MTPAEIMPGDRVRIDSWGLSGVVLTITGGTSDPEFFTLAFSNRNPVPGNWHCALMRRA